MSLLNWDVNHAMGRARLRRDDKTGLELKRIQHLDKTLAQLGRGGVLDLDSAQLTAGQLQQQINLIADGSAKKFGAAALPLATNWKATAPSP